MFVIRYIVFALIATIANLLVQWISFSICTGEWCLYLAMAAGTFSGLVVKYLLDKRWIFCYSVKSSFEDLWMFSLYSCMGIFTTLIFWGVEVIFYYFFSSPIAKYCGAILGLAIGYLVKYFLDKKFVFNDSQ